MLTRKQQQLLLYIHDYLKENGVSPSFDEMKEALDLKSKSGIHRLIMALEERGFIRRLPHRARALEVVKLPDSATPEGRSAMAEKQTGFQPQIVSNRNFPAASPPPPSQPMGDMVSLPLFGQIAAGTPIEALRDHNNYVDIPSHVLGRGEHYALEVAGDSMINAGILDGDTVVIERSDTAENGAIVVALVEGEEVTLKRIRRKGASIALEAENPSYETRIYREDQVKIQGRLVALFRQY
ncbi:MAG: transcriptional repressor LexA [Minwuia sp.]|uniref:transcriptional repressor LexA n=1 Tax=Minwuia sp. TaxID=2493630 RepID=UPI003A8481F5